MAFQMGLSEKLRAAVEYSGRVVLSDAEVTALVRTKTFHELVITLAVLVGVASGQVGTAIPIVFMSFWAAGVAEAFHSKHGANEIARTACVQTVAWFIGICAIAPLGYASIF